MAAVRGSMKYGMILMAKVLSLDSVWNKYCVENTSGIIIDNSWTMKFVHCGAICELTNEVI